MHKIIIKKTLFYFNNRSPSTLFGSVVTRIIPGYLDMTSSMFNRDKDQRRMI